MVGFAFGVGCDDPRLESITRTRYGDISDGQQGVVRVGPLSQACLRRVSMGTGTPLNICPSIAFLLTIVREFRDYAYRFPPLLPKRMFGQQVHLSQDRP